MRRKRKGAPERELSLDEFVPNSEGEFRLQIPIDGLSPQQALENKELRQALEQAINKLPKKYRMTLVLRDMEGLSAGEAGAIMGLSERAVKSRLHRARLFVRRELSTRGMAQDDRHSHEGWRRGRPGHDQKKKRTSTVNGGVWTSFAELSAYIDDELPEDICAEFRRHLGACPNCEVFIASLRDTVKLCRQHEPPPPLRPMTVQAPAGDSPRLEAGGACVRRDKSGGSGTRRAGMAPQQHRLCIGCQVSFGP